MGRFTLTFRATFVYAARRHYSSKQLDPMIVVYAMTGTVKNPTYSVLFIPGTKKLEPLD
jgi:hypothetical protein